MTPRLPSSFIQRMSADRLVVLVIVLGLGFVATVLVPGLRLASELVNTSAALKWVGISSAIRPSSEPRSRRCAIV